jgi:ferredoxin
LRLDLVRDAAVAARLPELLAERCVHSLIEQATCRRCVDACPTRAWVIDDERLGIDPARCDGCGLCAPVCPQAAIVARTVEPLLVDVSGRSAAPGAIAAMLACDRAFPGRSGFPAAIGNRDKNVAPTRPASPSDPAPGAIPYRGQGAAPTSAAAITPCIHALGPRDLARLAAAGCRTLLVATGDCDACPRGGAVRLERRLADLARLLDSRGLPVLRIERLSPDRWEAARDAAAPDPGPAIARRAFLRRGLGIAVDHAASTLGLAEAERAAVDTVARLLPDTGAAAALAPIGPRIDPVACTGCDACVRLCPQQAIRLERPQGEAVDRADAQTAVDTGIQARLGGEAAGGADAPFLAYRITPADCTGCGICVDVCAARAIRLEAWAPAAPVTLDLAEATCTRCRVRFHRPIIETRDGAARCPVCARRSGTDRLYRIQE